MESAVFGLIGVVVGSLLTVVKEWWFHERKNKKDAQYLVIVVSASLERYALGCMEVVLDQGLCDGQYDEDGCRAPQTSTPIFDTKDFAVDWKSLPAALMYRIMDLPFKAEIANQAIADAFEYLAGPPDYEEGFEERQFQYADLGLEALALAGQLRSHVGLPDREIEGWHPGRHLMNRKATIEANRSSRSERNDLI